MPAHQPTVHPPSPTHRRRCRPAGRSAAPAAPRSYRCAEAGRPQTCTRRCDAPRAAGEGARWRCHVVRRPAMGTAADGRQARSWQCPWQAKQGRLRVWQRQGMSSSCDCTRPGTSLQCATAACGAHTGPPAVQPGSDSQHLSPPRRPSPAPHAGRCPTQTAPCRVDAPRNGLSWARGKLGSKLGAACAAVQASASATDAFDWEPMAAPSTRQPGTRRHLMPTPAQSPPPPTHTHAQERRNPTPTNQPPNPT